MGGWRKISFAAVAGRKGSGLEYALKIAGFPGLARQNEKAGQISTRDLLFLNPSTKCNTGQSAQTKRGGFGMERDGWPGY